MPDMEAPREDPAGLDDGDLDGGLIVPEFQGDDEELADDFEL